MSITLKDFDDYLDRVINGFADPITPDKAKQYVPLVRRAQKERAGAVRNVPFSIMDGENDVSNTARFRAIPSLVYKAEMSLSAYGEAYWGKERNRGGFVWPVWYAPTTIRMDIVNGAWVGFTRRLNGAERPIEPKDMVYFWEPDEDAEVGPGQSALSTALYAASTLHNADRMLTAYFGRGAIRPTVWPVSQATLDASIKKIKDWWSRLLQGVDNAFNTMVFRGDAKPITIGDPLTDIWDSELQEDKREDIADAFGIPSSMLLSNSANYATAREDYIGWNYKFVFPRCAWFADEINRMWLADEGLEMVYHPELTEVWQESQLQQVDAVSTALQAGIIDVNEARAIVGFPEIDSKEESEPEPEENGAEPPEKATAETELAKWRRYAIKRYKEGQPDKALAFESAEIPPFFAAMIRTQLKDAATVEDVKAVFGGTYTGGVDELKRANDLLERTLADAETNN